MIQKVLKNKRIQRSAKFFILLCGSVLLFSSTSLALPEVGEVVSGEVVISNPNPQTLQINATDKAIINYNSFNIAENESVIVNLPSASNEILNRVTGNAASSLLGSLVCNGVFILTNPNGINIGATANIDAAGFIASTRDITNEDFLQSQHIFEKVYGKQDTQLVNRGTINIRKGGFGILIAGAVKNEGIITANVGTVALAAGDKVSVDISGDGLVSVNIDQETAETIYDINGNPITTQIVNTGTLEANGGQVILGAKSATDVFRAAINLEGIVQAMDVEEKDGKIILRASGDIIVNTPLEAGSVEAYSDANIKVERNIIATSGNVDLYADHDGDGGGTLTQSPGTTIQALEGNVLLDGSGVMTLAGVVSKNGNIMIGTRQAPAFIDAQTPLEANTLTLIGTSFDVNSLALTTDLSKLGDLQIQSSTLEGNLARLQGDGVNITYLTTTNLTLRSNNVIDTSPGVIIQANQVRLIGRQFGTLAVPLNIHASQITLQRTLGSIDILESIGMGEIIAMRAPPNGFGSIMYNRDATLVLEAESTTILGTTPTYLYGNITFTNFTLNTPDKEIYFEAGKTYTFKGALTITSIPDDANGEYFIKFRSQTPGSQYFLNIETSEPTLNFINITDANAINSIFIPIGVNGGNNTNILADPLWDGGGVDNNWSTPANWAGDAVPTGADPVTFDTTSPGGSNKNCTVDSVRGDWTGNVTISNYATTDAYATTGVFTVALSSGTFTVTGSFSLSALNSKVNVNSPMTVTGNISVTADGSGFTNNSTLNVLGNFAIGGITTITNNGTATIAGDITGGVTCVWTNAASSTLNIAGDLLSTGTLNANAAGNLVNYNGSAAQTVKTPASSYHDITINSTNTVTQDDPLTMDGDFTMTAGTYLQNDHLAVTGSFSQAAGTFTSNTSATFSATSFALNGGTFSRFAGGNGDPGTPYQITDVYGLQAMKCYLTKSFILNGNIDASGTSNWDTNGDATKEGFIPVGTSASKFSGNFDGDNHMISDLYINRSSTSYLGLFGYTSAGEIKDLNMTGVNIAIGYSHIGSLVGYSISTITNCSAAGSVTGAGDSYNVGGLVGRNAATIADSYFSGNVSGGSNGVVGGFVGYNGSVIERSYSAGTVTGGGTFGTGGFAGFNQGASASITDCYSTASVAAAGIQYTGGFVGYAEETITNCYATGNVAGGQYTGGFVGGLWSAVISGCFSTGTVSGGLSVGGFVGHCYESTVTDCYSWSAVTGSSSVGGFAGALTNDSIINSYSAGLVTSGGANVGGFLGLKNSGTITSCYYDSTTSGKSDVGKGVPKTTVLMKTQATFSGWDFTSIWTIAETVTYPLLQWNAFTWDNGSGVDSNWSTAGNWVGDIMPGAGSTVTFNNTSMADSYVDAGFGGTVAAVNVYGSYNTGTITQQRSLIVSGNFDQDGGTYDLNGNTLNIGGDLAISGGTFINDSTLTFDGTGTSTVTDSRGTLGDLGAVVVDGTSKTINLASNIKVTSLSIGADDTLGLSTYTLYITGAGTGGSKPFANSGTFNEGTGTVEYKSAADTDILGETYYNLIINGTGPFYQNAGAIVNVTNDFTMTSGIYNQNEDLAITGNFSMAAGTFTSDTDYDFSATSFALSGGTFSRFAGGNGDPGTPYQIVDVYGLQAMISHLTKSFILNSNIDASGTSNWDTDGVPATKEGFIPVGTSASKFSGNFDGDNYTISDLYINRSSTNYIGLFGYTSAGEIKDTALTGVNITAYEYTGALVGTSYSAITNCSSTGTIVTYQLVGGLVGDNYSTITDSYSTANVSTTRIVGSYAGGLVGRSNGAITGCYATGSVTGVGAWAGGFVGYNWNSISESYSTGTVSVPTHNAIGGFAGKNEGASASILNCYATGSVTGNAYVGGFVGENKSAVENCYSIGSVTAGTGLEIGGFVGWTWDDGVSTHCYYDSQTSGRSDSNGGSLPKTTAEMKQQATFVGWDFATVWYILEGNDYPRLDWTAVVWNNGAGLGDPNWSTDANWVGGVAPTATDVVIFNNTSVNNASVDLGFGGTIASLYIASNYTGIITQARSLETTGNLTQGAGTIDVADNTLTVNGDLTVSGGLLDASDASAFLAIGGDLTVSSTGKLYSPTTSDYTQFAVIGDVTLSDSAIFTNNGILQFFTSPSSVLADNRVVPSNIGAVVLTTSSTVTLGSDIKASAFAVANTCVLNLDTYTLTLTNAGQGASQPFQILAGGTFNADTGTIKLMGVGDTDIEDTTYYKLMLSQAGTTFYSTGDATVSNVFTIDAGTFDAQDDTWHLTGSGTPFVVNGIFKKGTSTVSYEYAGALTTNVTNENYYTLQFSPVSGTPTYTLPAGTTLKAYGDFIITGAGQATVTAAVNNGRVTLEGSLSIDSDGVFVKGTEYFIFNDATVSTWTDNNATKSDMGTVVIVDSSPNVVNLGSDVKATSLLIWSVNDTLGLESYTLTLTGSGTGASMPFQNAGTFNEGTGTVEFTGTSVTDIMNETYYNLKLNGATTFYSYGDTTVSNVLTVETGATLNAKDDTWHLLGSGTPLVVTGTFEPSTSTVSYEGAGATGITAVDYYDLTLDGTGVFTPAGSLNIENNFTLTSGTLNAAANTLTVGKDFTNAGTFNAGTSTVEFNDNTKTSNIFGATTFNNFKSITAGKTLNFEAGKTQLITGTLTLTGTAGNLIVLNSTLTGTQWKIDPQGTRSVSYVDVKDSNNINTLIINPSNSINSGNNINWFTNPLPSEPEIDHSTIDNNPVIILLNFFVPFVEAGIESFNFGDWQDAFNPGFNSFAWEEGESKYGKGIYNSGKYRTIAALVEGKIVFGAYDENGLKEEDATVIMPGETRIMQGEVGGEMLELGFNLEVAVKDEGEILTTAVYFSGKYKTMITAIEGIFDVTPYDEENVYSDHTSVIQAGQTAIQAREIK